MSRSSAFCLIFSVYFAGCHAEPDEPGQLPPTPPNAAIARKAPVSVPVAGCDKEKDLELSSTFVDDFSRTELGDDWRSTGYGAYYVRGGRLCISKPRNHPVWLKRKLPANVRVSFEAIPLTANGDLKIEIFGDGCAMDTEGREYTATSYVAVLGAHNNAEHWLARLFEHGADLRHTPLVAGAATIAQGKLAQNQTYRVELARTDGKTLEFSVDGVRIHSFEDPQPLLGPGHDHFAFNGWDNAACFDKLVVTPLQ